MIKKNSILRFFIIYFCVLLPLLGTNILITQNFLARAQREEQSKLSEQLEEAVELISDIFWEYRKKGVVLFENKEFSSNLGLASATSVNEAARFLNSLRMFDGSENSILAYYGEGMLYSPDGMERLHTFFGMKLSCTEESAEAAIEAINSEQFSIIPLQRNSELEYLFFHIPADKDIYGYSRSMEVVISMSQLEKMLSTCLHSEGVLFQLSIGDVEGYFYHMEHGLRRVSTEEANGLIAGYRDEPLVSGDETLQFTARLWGDTESQLADFYEMRNLNLILLMIGLLLSVMLSFALSVIRFSQLKTLINNITHKNMVSKEKKSWIKNEFDYIQILLDEAIKENISVRKNERSHRKIIFQQVSILIFHGLLREREEIQIVLKVCGVELLEDYYFLYGLKVNTQEQLEKLDELLQGDIHYTVNEDGRKYVFVLCELPFFDCQMSRRYELADKLQKVLQGAGITCNKIAMSQVYSQISMANNAYLEVLSILENSFDRKTPMTCWEEWIRHNERVGVWFDNEQLKYFREAVKLKQEQQALEVLKRTLSQETEKESRRHLCYMFLQSLMLEVNLSDEEEEKQQFVLEISSINVNDEQSFVESVSHILQKYCEHKNTSNDFDRVIQFVKDNYTNYELSLIMVAEYAGLSKSKTSRLFKVYTGEAYIDYVTRLRMEKAKELLEQTDISVKEIFLQVGYLDITNASKKFKAYFQINPSAYRAQKRKESEEKNE